MKPLLLLAAATLVPLAACSSNKPARVALDCPATQGDLTRTSAAGDGKTCVYASADGAQVTLQLIPVSGGAFATLDRLEATLLAEAQARPDQASGPVATDAVNAETAVTPASAADARRVEAEAARDAASAGASDDEPSSQPAGGEGVDVRMENGKVVVKEGGNTTRVNLPGIRIEADEADESASVRIGPLHVDANGGEARMRIRRDVRLKGEALAREKRGVRATFILGDRTGDERGYLGYEAGGPKTGPLAVAVVRGDHGFDGSHDILDDVKRLVRKNGGV